MANMKPMTKHTPGPWSVHVFDGFDRFEVQGPQGFEDGSQPLADIVGEGIPPRVMEANARLIAAAPCLLRVAKEVLLDLEHLDKADSVMANSLRAAIAKAE